MRRLLVATGNQGKLRELRELLAGSVEELLSLADFPNLPAVDEDGATFAENAVKKARAAALAKRGGGHRLMQDGIADVHVERDVTAGRVGRLV